MPEGNVGEKYKITRHFHREMKNPFEVIAEAGEDVI